MANMLSSGIDWMSAVLDAFASSTVTYTRGASSLSLTATIGRHVAESDGGQEGMELDAFDVTFTFLAASLVLNSALTVPARGDTITLVSNSKTFVYEVLPHDGGRWWKESDAFGKRLEVRAKLSSRT